jgi:hypothetical protein
VIGQVGHPSGGLARASCWHVGRPYANVRLMSEIIFVVEEAPEGGYVARALGHDIFTEADDPASLREIVRDAVRCHFDDERRPEVIRLHFVRDEVIAA